MDNNDTYVIVGKNSAGRTDYLCLAEDPKGDWLYWGNRIKEAMMFNSPPQIAKIEVTTPHNLGLVTTLGRDIKIIPNGWCRVRVVKLDFEEID